MGNEMITIPKEEYDDLVDARNELEALYEGGVTNWQWYEASLEDAGLLDKDAK